MQEIGSTEPRTLSPHAHPSTQNLARSAMRISFYCGHASEKSHISQSCPGGKHEGSVPPAPRASTHTRAPAAPIRGEKMMRKVERGAEEDLEDMERKVDLPHHGHGACQYVHEGRGRGRGVDLSRLQRPERSPEGLAATP